MRKGIDFKADRGPNDVLMGATIVGENIVHPGVNFVMGEHLTAERAAELFECGVARGEWNMDPDQYARRASRRLTALAWSSVIQNAAISSAIWAVAGRLIGWW